MTTTNGDSGSIWRWRSRKKEEPVEEDTAGNNSSSNETPIRRRQSSHSASSSPNLLSMSRSRSTSPSAHSFREEDFDEELFQTENGDDDDDGEAKKPLTSSNSKMKKRDRDAGCCGCCWGNSLKMWVLLILCLQNSMFTVLRRYSQGVLKEAYSKYEVLLFGEVVKMFFSAWMIGQSLKQQQPSLLEGGENGHAASDHSKHSTSNLQQRLWYIVRTSQKMLVLALIYGAMNILSFVSLRNIGAGLFTICAQCKILTTALFSTLLLQRRYSATQWRALIGLMFGVLLFSEPTLWGPHAPLRLIRPANGDGANPLLGTVAVLTEVTLSGFASIYFEKVIKTDHQLQLSIWERNFQLAVCSLPVYGLFILADGGGPAGRLGGGWSAVTVVVALLGAAGGLLVALSLKYGDAILKTLATTGAIVLSSVLDHAVLGGPLTPTMMIAAVQVILAIFNYTFDATNSKPPPSTPNGTASASLMASPYKSAPNLAAQKDIELANNHQHGDERGSLLLKRGRSVATASGVS